MAVRVEITEETGAWGIGSQFKTSDSHAEQMTADGVAKIIEQPAAAIRRRIESIQRQGQEVTVASLKEQLEWPGWLSNSQLDALEKAEMEPGEALDMDPNTLQERVPGIGPKSCAMLQRDLNLQWTALTVEQEN